MAIAISTAARNAAVDGVTALLNVGGAGSLVIRTGAAPATPATADSGTLLATCPLNATAFGAASSGTATANAITSDTNVDASGQAGHFRLKNNAGTVVMQGTCGQGSGDLSFDEDDLVAGGTVAITSFTISIAAS
jgi:hypothetical protein